MGSGDRLVWYSSRDGVYNVNVGYTLARTLQRRKAGDVGPSHRRTQAESVLWKKLWSLNVKRKILHFLWRACHNSIPVAGVLKRRGIRIDGICVQCEEATETVEHLFFHCVKAQTIWKLAPVSWDGLKAHTLSFQEWWRMLGLAGQSGTMTERLELTAYILWHVWKSRNNWLFKGTAFPELEVIQQAMEEWMEYDACHPKSEGVSERRARVDRQEAWQHPAPGVVKLNVSSIWEGAGKSVGVGVIARNHLGTAEKAWSVIREEVANPVVAETDAVRVALVLAQQNGWRKVEIGVDTKALSSCLQAQKTPIMEASVVAEDIYFLATMFESCKFSFDHKRFNKSCSSLASLAYSRLCSQSWSIVLPDWLQAVALSDLGSFDHNVQ